MKTLKQIFRNICDSSNVCNERLDCLECARDAVREWLLLNLIDITELVGAEIYDANLINEYITDKLLEEL